MTAAALTTSRSVRPSRTAVWTIGLAAALLVIGCVAVTIGPVGISLDDVSRSIGYHLGIPGVKPPPLLTDSIV